MWKMPGYFYNVPLHTIYNGMFFYSLWSFAARLFCSHSLSRFFLRAALWPLTIFMNVTRKFLPFAIFSSCDQFPILRSFDVFRAEEKWWSVEKCKGSRRDWLTGTDWSLTGNVLETMDPRQWLQFYEKFRNAVEITRTLSHQRWQVWSLSFWFVKLKWKSYQLHSNTTTIGLCTRHRHL